jgi:RNA polymerase sigma-70 factor (ECF subfamily)
VQLYEPTTKVSDALGVIGSARAVDAERLTQLVRDHLPRVFRLLRHLGVGMADIDDAIQQVLLVVVRRLPQLEFGVERQFLSATAVRIASRWRRTHRRRRETAEPIELELRAVDAPNPERMLERTEAQRLLIQILDTMPPKLRDTFVLFEIEELTMREIAETLGISQGTVASRLRLGRQHFHDRVVAIERAATPRRPA